MKTSNTNSLAHTTWDCKYHLVFAPKFRRQIIYRELRADIGKILRELCERKGIEIVEAQCCPDHVHMLVKIPPKYSVSEIMGLPIDTIRINRLQHNRSGNQPLATGNNGCDRTDQEMCGG